MPVTVSEPIQVIGQDRFAEISFEVLEHAFAIHNGMGRFFEESVYEDELRHALGDRASTQVWIHVTFGTFHKPYRMDLLVDHSALFELKTTAGFDEQHRTQLIHYLMLTGLHHGKLINFRPQRVEHEFVNCLLTPEARRAFSVRADRWVPTAPGCAAFQEVAVGFLRDWGAGLDLQLYEEAVTHFLGGPEHVHQEIDVVRDGRVLGRQTVRLVNPETAFKLTTLQRDLSAFESHTKRFLQHTRLRHVAWINITLEEVTFVLVSK
jgi:GxxExxY protein